MFKVRKVGHKFFITLLLLLLLLLLRGFTGAARRIKNSNLQPFSPQIWSIKPSLPGILS